MDDIRAQLDALMGQDRNVPLSERDKYRKERKFSDDDICKYYICGFCPYEEFRRTKNDCGDCPAVHDDNCKQQWEELDDRGKERYGYEAELLRWFERLLGDLRKRIDANTRRLDSLEVLPLLPEDQQRLDNLTAQINELLARAATLGEQGDVDAAQAAATEAERLKGQQTALEQAGQARANARAGRNLHQKVCQVSGLIINDEESRLQDHYSGRNYNSWKKLHEVHAQLLEAARRRSVGGGYRSGGREERPRERERERERERRPDRDRDERRRRSRSRSWDRRERDRRRYDDRDRDGRRRHDDRDRERERERGSRRRSRSRSRERTRSAHKSEGPSSQLPPPPAAQPDLLPAPAGPYPPPPGLY